MKKISLFILTLSIIFSSVNVSAASIGDQYISSQGAFVMDYETGEELYGYNADVPRASASMAKIMSLYVVFEAIKNGEINYDTITKASTETYKITTDGESQAALSTDFNVEYRVDELIDISLIYSACDAVLALAELVSGSEEEFVKRMNETGRKMGLNAQFVDSSGLKPNMISPRSMAVLAANIIRDYPQVLSISSMPSVEFHGKTYKNTNKLLTTYPGADGLKTGTTSLAGYCFCGTAQKDGNRIITVTMASSSGSKRFTDTEIMMDFGFSAINEKRNIYTTSLKATINSVEIPCFYTKEFNGCGVILAEDLANYGYDVYFNSDTQTLYLTYNPEKEFSPIPMDYYHGLEPNEKFMKFYPKTKKVVIKKDELTFEPERVLTLDGYIAVGIDELQRVCDSFYYGFDENIIKIQY